MLSFSILIPTYNRKAKLQAVLERLGCQEGIEQGEVIVGIDGSSDGTEEWMQGTYGTRSTGSGQAPGTDGTKGRMQNISWFRIENSGRSVIRNRLLERARGEIVIFIQDDILVTEGWLRAILQFHQQKRGALVGHMTWYPEVAVTPYMKWLENGGHMLDFSGFREGDEMDFWHFYMGNISFPRDLVGDLRFQESVPSYGWEDILFGYEFVSRGNKVYYSASALAYHWDEYREEDLREYMIKVGRSAVWAEQQYPGIGIVPPLWKRTLFRCLIFVGFILRPFLSRETRWYLDMKQWFLQAVEEDRR
ncbi:MAG: glycosyltransferase family 2 protein [Candidatus Altimarinota bacterium]